MRKFTKEELLEAVKQINEEQILSRKQADRAAEWLKNKCERSVESVSVKQIYNHEAHYLPKYKLGISYCQYTSSDHFNLWLRERLPKIEGKINLDDPNCSFEIELGQSDGFPDGTKYLCYMSYYDAHASGF